MGVLVGVLVGVNRGLSRSWKQILCGTFVFIVVHGCSPAITASRASPLVKINQGPPFAALRFPVFLRRASPEDESLGEARSA